MSSKENWEIKWRQSSRCCRLNEGNKKQGSFMGWHQQGMEATLQQNYWFEELSPATGK